MARDHLARLNCSRAIGHTAPPLSHGVIPTPVLRTSDVGPHDAGGIGITQDVLLQACRNLDAAALDSFYATFRPVATRAAIRLGCDDIEEVVQETFHRILLAFASGRGPSERPDGYVAAVARTVAIDHASLRTLPFPPNFDVAAADADTRVGVATVALSSLPGKETRVAWAHWVEGEPLTTIATREGIASANAVAQRLHRTKQKLRSILTSQGLPT